MAPTLDATLRSFDRTDSDGNGQPEINSLRLAGASASAGEPSRQLGLVVNLVEARLLRTIPGAPDLSTRLDRLVADQRRAGFEARLVAADLYNGSDQRDGRILLALRRALQALHGNFKLAGVVLIGQFPQAQLVRRWPWAPSFDRDIGNQRVISTPYLAYEPEPVAASADIVLGDLSGNWEKTYMRTLRAMTLHVVSDGARADQLMHPGAVVSGRVADKYDMKYEDVFWIDDGDVVVQSENPLTVKLVRFRADPEVSPANKQYRNPIATPTIFVSRINAYHAGATRLPMDHSRVVKDSSGSLISGQPFDANGSPQTFVSSVNYATESLDGGKTWTLDTREFETDEVEERRLLCEHLDRNHDWRTPGAVAHVQQTLSLAFAFNAQDSVAWLDRLLAHAPHQVVNNADIADYAKSWSMAAAVRSIVAHSDERYSNYGDTTDQAKLQAALGGLPFLWRQEEVAPQTNPRRFRYVPTLSGTGGNAGHWLHRTLRHYGRIAPRTGVVIHGGCGCSSPMFAYERPYFDPWFGSAQNCESMVMNCGAIAAIGRSKVYNDGPEGFIDFLARNRNATLGEAWQNLFVSQAANGPERDDVNFVADFKKCYPWNLFGDWTLRLHADRT